VNIVITMAGMGSRFRKAGYDLPKYMIESRGKTLFNWSMISLKDFYDDSRFIFIARKEDGAGPFIESECRKLGIADYELCEIDELTDGQATTALLAEEHWNPKEPVLIYNIDTYVEEGELLKSDIRGEGFIPCFVEEGDHWSFVKLDSQGDRAVEVREKERISENCTLGAYYFKSGDLYREIYEEYYSDERNLEKGEKYIAPMYNLMIAKGYGVHISTVDKDKVHALGTPEELKNFESEVEK
jgi:dTDP-glucose pyrophosphorylase